MHDIICPHCGTSILACNVSFDVSTYIYPLLCDQPSQMEVVKKSGMRFYVDEDFMRKNMVKDNRVPLFSQDLAEISLTGDWYPVEIHAAAVLDYMMAKVSMNKVFGQVVSLLKRMSEGDRKNFVENNRLTETSGKDKDASKNQASTEQSTASLTQMDLETLLNAMYISMYRSESDDSELNMNTAIAKGIRQILASLVLNMKTDRNVVTLRVRMFSYMDSHGSKYHVPDMLCIHTGAGIARLKKCCSTCGHTFPIEFGYYKMQPVVLLGSHNSGKTSYLLSLLFTMRNCMPFVDVDNLSVSTLNEDKDLESFDKNIRAFEIGRAPTKTDFDNAPVLNLLINNTIYSFIDWTGEAFINDSADVEGAFKFITQNRPVIMRAKHFLLFLEPTQVNAHMDEGEELTYFNPSTLTQRFNFHMSFATPKKVRSVTYVINKVDMFSDTPSASSMLKMFEDMTESDIYSDGVWNQEKIETVERQATNFLKSTSFALISGLNMKVMPNAVFSCLPVSPYGCTPGADKPNNTSKMYIHRGNLSGVPLLKILHIDHVLKETAH